MSILPPEDELKRAMQRLRTFAREVPEEAAATRRRVLADERSARSSHGRIAWIAAGLIALFGGPAFAHFTGVIDLVPAWLAPEARSTKPPRANGRRIPSPTVSSVLAPEPTPAVEPEAAAPAAQTEPVASPRRPKPARATTTPPASDTRELYRLAHAAHFGGSDPERALRAWDTFLAAAPSDAFAPEARYNRAILLVKLERHPQALSALEPFACAPRGAYRQREARALIDRMRTRAPKLEPPACMKEAP
jgi:hypothetical protein